MELVKRKDVPVEETWDLSLIFKEEKDMWGALDKVKEKVKNFAETYAGKLNTAESIVNCLDEMEEILPLIYRIGSYTGLAVEADYTDNKIREADEKVSAEITAMQSQLSFVDSEILKAADETLREAVELAKGCKTYLQDLIKRKEHMLSPETEKTLKTLGRSLSVPYTIYSTMKLADISFDPFTVDGKDYPLGYSLYEDYYESLPDTKVRRAAFKAFYDTLSKYKNTTAAAYNACVIYDKTGHTGGRGRSKQCVQKRHALTVGTGGRKTQKACPDQNQGKKAQQNRTERIHDILQLDAHFRHRAAPSLLLFCLCHR